ncbi:MAG: O-antigen ligase family protein [Anaerolineales bacterium]|jgi:hypothetical protein
MLLRSIKEDRSVQIQLVLAIIIGLLLGGTTVYTSPIIVLAAFVTFFLAILILRRPEIAILGLVVLLSSILGWESNPRISIGFGSIYVTDVLLFLSLLMIIIRAVTEPDFKLIHTPIDLPLILFVGFAFLSTFIAIMQYSMTLNESLHEMRIVAHYLIFFAATNLLRNDKQLKFLYHGLIAIATTVAVATLVQYVLGTSTPFLPGRVEHLQTEGVTYSSITRIIPPGYSLMFIIFICLSAYLLFDKLQTRNWILLLPWALTGMGVIISFKRHLWVAVMVIFAILFYLGRNRDLQRFIAGAIAIIGIMIVGIIYLYNFTGTTGPNLVESSIDRLVSLVQPSTYTDPESSLRWRDFEYEYAFPQISAHPILGLGLGAEYRPWIPPNDWEGFDGRKYIHNGNVWVLVKGGVLTYLPLLWLVILGIYRGFKYWRSVPESWKRLLVLGFTLSLVGMFIGSFIEPTWMKESWTALIGILLGINELLIRIPSNRNLELGNDLFSS